MQERQAQPGTQLVVQPDAAQPCECAPTSMRAEDAPAYFAAVIEEIERCTPIVNACDIHTKGDRR